MMRFVALLALVSLAPLTASADEIVFVQTLKNGRGSSIGVLALRMGDRAGGHVWCRSLNSTERGC